MPGTFHVDPLRVAFGKMNKGIALRTQQPFAIDFHL